MPAETDTATWGVAVAGAAGQTAKALLLVRIAGKVPALRTAAAYGIAVVLCPNLCRSLPGAESKPPGHALTRVDAEPSGSR